MAHRSCKLLHLPTAQADPDSFKQEELALPGRIFHAIKSVARIMFTRSVATRPVCRRRTYGQTLAAAKSRVMCQGHLINPDS